MSTENYPFIHAKSSWMSAHETLRLAQKLAEIGAAEGNIDSYMRQGVYDDYLQAFGEPEEGSSNFIATVPLLYAMTNALELLVKGLMYVSHPKAVSKRIYKTPELIKKVREEHPAETDILCFIDAYGSTDGLPELFAEFLKENELSIEDFYGVRRYFAQTSFFSIVDRYKPIFYTVAQGRLFYQRVLDDIHAIMPTLEALKDGINEDGIPDAHVRGLYVSSDEG
ncbi:MAG: hypothetical protein LBS98_08175 [Coriobacteriales bacterium]|jgi:hypothetical protein|nr:hypothetical protein [Coriobacteriales bacterium]